MKKIAANMFHCFRPGLCGERVSVVIDFSSAGSVIPGPGRSVPSRHHRWYEKLPKMTHQPFELFLPFFPRLLAVKLASHEPGDIHNELIVPRSSPSSPTASAGNRNCAWHPLLVFSTIRFFSHHAAAFGPELLDTSAEGPLPRKIQDCACPVSVYLHASPSSRCIPTNRAVFTPARPLQRLAVPRFTAVCQD
jgi:hypothetical protein